MPLYNHQKAFLTKNPNKSALIWSCGTGKTKTAIEWAKKRSTSVLVICPKALKANWLREILMNDLGKRGTMILTKEEFRKLAPTLKGYDQVIVDEVHMGFLTPLWKSQMSKALKKYLERNQIPRVLLLSATPYTSSPWNVYNLAWLLGHRWNWMSFRIKFFIDVRMGPRVVPIARKGCEKELVPLIKEIANVVDIHDVMDVPPQLHDDPEYFSLTPSQQRAIRDAYDPLPIVRYTKQHEVEQGFILEDPIKCFPYDKLDRIKAIVEENDKVAIVCRYNAQIDMLAVSLQEAGHDPYVIRGDVKDRDTICRQAETAKKAIVIIQADCAEGYQLPSFETVVFASQSYSYVKWEQMCGRFLRMDKPTRTTFLYLLTEGKSVDQAVYNAIKRKEDFKIELFK